MDSTHAGKRSWASSLSKSWCAALLSHSSSSASHPNIGPCSACYLLARYAGPCRSERWHSCLRSQAERHSDPSWRCCSLCKPHNQFRNPRYLHILARLLTFRLWLGCRICSSCSRPEGATVSLCDPSLWTESAQGMAWSLAARAQGLLQNAQASKRLPLQCVC